MANKTISDLNELTTVSNSDVLLVETNTETSKVTKENLLKEVKEQLNTKSNVGHTHDEYVTNGELATKADKTAIPTKTSQLTNDSGFLTKHQNISSKADKTYVDNQLATKSNTDHTHSYNDLTDKPTIPSTTNLATKKELTDGLATKSDATHNHDKVYALKTDIPTVPTKTSQLTNDSGFIKSIPSEYITETELSAKSYATETYVNNKMIPNLVENTATNKTLTLTVDKYQYAVLSNEDSVVLPSVSSFTEIHLFFKASADLTLTFSSVRWQSIPSITSGHTYEIIFRYVVDEWLAGVICYE